MEEKDLEKVVDEVTKGVAEKTTEAVETAVKAETAGIKEEVEKMQKDFEAFQLKAKFSGSKEEKELQKKEFVVNTIQSVVKNNIEFNQAVDMVSKTMTEGTAGDGAELVFDQFMTDIEKVINSYPIPGRVKFMNIQKGDTVKIPKATNSVITYWVDEGAAYTGSEAETAYITFSIAKAATLTDMTEELLWDTMTVPDLYNLLVEFIGESQAEFLENQILNGDNTGSNFNGIFNDSNVNIITMDAGDENVTDIDDNYLTNVEAAIPMKYKRNPSKVAWTMSQYTFNKIRQLKTTTGAILYPELRMSNPTLLGYAVVVSDKAPIQNAAADLKNTKFLALGDWTRFIVMSRKGITFELGYYGDNWKKDIKSLKSNRRMDGEKTFADAFAVLKTW